MQPDPANSKKMISADDHGRDEQDQYEVRVTGCRKLRDTEFFSYHDPYVVLDYTITVAHDFRHNMDLERHMWRRWYCFRKYPLQPLVGLQHLPVDHPSSRLHNKMDDLEGFTCDGTSPVGVDDINPYFCCTIQTPLYLRKGLCDLNHLTHRPTRQQVALPATPGPGDEGFVLYSKRSHVRKNILMLSSARSGGSSSEGTGFTLSGGNNHHRETDSASNDMPVVILDNQAQVNCTGNFIVLSNLSIGPENIVLIAANGEEMPTYMSGSVHLGNFELNDVHYCPDLGNRIIVSGSKLDKADYGYEFRQGKFIVKDLVMNGRIVGEGRLVDGNYVMDYLMIGHDRTPGLVTSVRNAICSVLHRLGL